MKVVSIRRNQFLSGYMSQRAEFVPEWLLFFGGASATTLGPTLLYCAVSSQLLPLYVMTCVMTLGASLGVAMFKRPGADLVLRIPVAGEPRVPRGALAGGSRRVA
jgi:hypothetical protein